MILLDSLFLAPRRGDRCNPDDSNGAKKSEEICVGLEVSSEIDVLPKRFEKSPSETRSNPLTSNAKFGISVVSFIVCEGLLTSFNAVFKIYFVNCNAAMRPATT